MPQLLNEKKKKPFFNIKQALQVAEAIPDPAERKKEFDRIQRVVLGAEPPTPARAAVTGPVLPKPTPTIRVPQQYGPTVDAAQAHNELIRDMELADKVKPKTALGGPLQAQHMEAYTDEELKKLAEGFAGPEAATEAQAETTTRNSIDEKGLSKLFDPAYIKRLAGNVVGGAANLPTSAPISLAGMVALGGEKLTGADLGSETLLNIGGDVRRDVNNRIGISDPRDVGESIAGMIPNLIPIGGPVVGMPALSGRSLMEVVTPFVIGASNKRVAANFVTAAVADQAIREVADDSTSPYKTLFDQAGLSTDALGKDVADPTLALNIAAGAGILTAASFIPAQVAKTMRVVKSHRTPTITDVVAIDPHGPKDLKSLERAGDLLFANIVDEKSALTGFARRAGVADLDQVTKLIDNDTHVAAVMRVNEAMRTGRLNTYGGRWTTPITPMQLRNDFYRLPQQMQKDVDDYLKYGDLADDMRERIAKKIDPAEAMHVLATATGHINTIRQRTPIVDDFARKYQTITSSIRDYLGQGPNAMLSPKAIQKLGVIRKNFVPTSMTSVDPNQSLLARLKDANAPIDQRQLDGWYRQRRDLSAVNSIEGRANAFDVLVDYTHNSLRAKMEHDVRGAYVNSMRASRYGGETIRPAKKSELNKHAGRIVEVYEGGKLKQYLSSKLQSELLKFDPYVAKFPKTYAIKRLMELGTTGPLTMLKSGSGFAPTTLIRDTLGGMVFMPKSYRGPGIAAPLVAIPKMLYAKAQLAAFDTFGQNFEHMPFLSTPAKTALAHHMSASYMNSFYHAFNEAGGIDASLMRTSVESGRSMLKEVIKSGDWLQKQLPGANFVGGSLGNMARGLSALFDSISEAPRFAAAERSMRSGKSATEAVTQARKITGDNTRSGRVYDRSGRRMDVDAVNKKTAGVFSMAGWPVEYLREATPYLNPMVQGIRRVGERLIDNPMETNLKAWAMLGLPALTILGWNEMLGEEYNKFAFEQRSSNDIAMKLYIGIPGLPPERGPQIPIPHELTLFKSPFETGVYSLIRGAEGEEIKNMMQHMARVSLENAGMIGFPTAVGAGLNAVGVKAPQSINPLAWATDSYELREDNVGLFPANWEAMIRTIFGSVADHTMRVAAAAWDGGPEAFFEEMKDQMLKNTPILRDVSGTTTPVSSFTPLSQKRQTKVNAMREFFKLYSEHIDPRKEGRIQIDPASTTHGIVDDTDPKNSVARIAPLPTPKPSNPLLYVYGDMIKKVLDNNDEGYAGLQERYGIVGDQLALLKSYNAGNKNKFSEWQKTYTGKDKEFQAKIKPLKAKLDAIPMGPDGKAQQGFRGEYKALQKEIKDLSAGLGEFAKNDRLINGMHLDLSKRSDVRKLVGVLEKERGQLMLAQTKLIDDVEDRINKDLAANGMLAPNQRFSIEKHLGSLLPPGLLLAPELRQPPPMGPR